MDSKDLAIFKKVYELSSFNKAAEAVYMSTQGVSKVIQKLESETNTTLFERTSKGVKPTAYADILYSKSSRILELFDSIHTDMIDGIQKEKLHIGLSYGILPLLDFDFFDSFEKENISITIDYLEDNDHNLEIMIQRGSLDIAIIGMPMVLDPYESEYLCSIHHIAIVNEGSDLSNNTNLDYKDLNQQNICMAGKNFNPYHHNMMRLTKHNVSPASITETSEIAYTHLFASQNKGIGISVDFKPLYDLYENICILPFQDTSFAWDICLILKKGHRKTPAEQAFIDYVHTCFAGFK